MHSKLTHMILILIYYLMVAMEGQSVTFSDDTDHACSRQIIQLIIYYITTMQNMQEICNTASNQTQSRQTLSEQLYLHLRLGGPKSNSVLS